MKLVYIMGMSLLLTSCGDVVDSLDQSEVPDYTKEWLREQHGQVLTFRNSAGQVRTITVARKEQILQGQSKAGSFETEIITLHYRNGPDSLLNLTLEAISNSITVTHLGSRCGVINTSNSPGRTSFNSYEVPRLGNPIVAQDTMIGGRTYRYLGRMGVPTAAHLTDTLTNAYFSRAEGLVAFTTKRAGLWHRQ
ncbi:hypothetical protein SAMN06265337_0107 [Hymenobacter gelipurpurascens]|uniref:Uncharacterized protein n=1 Tax=Hymenobacter gelipurpurascens TaxID=89968 RepID=A0A212T102_9BACT|nr:hypothetical protein [Hymenobacter gelipurpurascens]SNC59707.1 hypothetical protein SAMN06265337_0107 [Hymenobacter gelipurpurascens]